MSAPGATSIPRRPVPLQAAESRKESGVDLLRGSVGVDGAVGFKQVEPERLRRASLPEGPSLNHAVEGCRDHVASLGLGNCFVANHDSPVVGRVSVVVKPRAIRSRWNNAHPVGGLRSAGCVHQGSTGRQGWVGHNADERGAIANVPDDASLG